MVFDYEELLLSSGVLTHMLTPPLPPALLYLFPGQHNQDILNYLLTLHVAVPSSQPSVAVGNVSIHRISALFEHVNVLIVWVSSLTTPSSGLPVDGTSAMDDPASLLRQRAQDRKEDEDRRKSDRELRCHDDERLRTQIFEEMDHRGAAFREVASGVTGELVGIATGTGEVRGVSSSGSLPALDEVVGLPSSGE